MQSSLKRLAHQKGDVQVSGGEEIYALKARKPTINIAGTTSENERPRKLKGEGSKKESLGSSRSAAA